MICTHQCYLGDQIKNEISRACGTYRRQEECIQGFGKETREKKPLGRHRCRQEDNIKIDIQNVGWGGMNWSDLAQDRSRWRALVNAVMNFGVPQMQAVSRLAEDMLPSLVEGLCSMELVSQLVGWSVSQS